MPDPRSAALKKNFEYFQEVVAGLMADNKGRYALLRSCAVDEIFDRPFEALEAGHRKFADGVFSIQKVTDRPFDLGFMSYGEGDRTTDSGQADHPNHAR